MNKILCLNSRTINNNNNKNEEETIDMKEKQKEITKHTLVTIHMDSMSTMKTEKRVTILKLYNKTKYGVNEI